jgi:hypothetical protein
MFFPSMESSPKIKLFMRKLCLLTILAITFSCSGNRSTITQENIDDEKGWVSLFDGHSLKGWRNFNSDQVGPAWKAKDGVLFLDPSDGRRGGDIVTDQEFENFELKLEWKIDSCGNSGIMFNVVEGNQYEAPWNTGPEMQILDNTCHPDGTIPKHRAGDLFDLIAGSGEVSLPQGEWNQVHIISKDASYEFWLNGAKVVSFKMHTPEWEELIRVSKFNEFKDFGKARKGHITIQDWGDKVWFRHIKIKTL